MSSRLGESREMIKIRGVLMFAAACSVLIVVATAQESVRDRQQGASSVFNYALQIAASGDQIWPGFDLRRYAFLKSGAGSNEIRFTNDMEKKRPSWAVGEDFYSQHSVEEDLVMTFHEAFHGFERDRTRKGAEWRAESAELVFEYPGDSARNNVLFNIEGRILFSALQASNVSTLRKRLRQFISVRQLRQGELEPLLVSFEKDAELNEGLAEYAGTKAVLVGIKAANRQQISVPFQFRNVNDFIEKKFERFNSTVPAKNNIRTKFYNTGAAQGLLLDRLMPDWKMRVQEHGTALQELLEEATKFLGGNSQSTPESALRQYGYADLLKDEEQFAAKRQAEVQAQLDSVLNQEGQRYVIDVSAIGKMGEVQGFDPWNLTIVSREVRLHKRMLNVAEEGYYKMSFSQPVVEDRRNRQYITISAPETTQVILVDDVLFDTTKSGEKQFEKKLVITSPKFNLEAKAGVVIVTEKGILIKLKKD